MMPSTMNFIWTYRDPEGKPDDFIEDQYRGFKLCRFYDPNSLSHHPAVLVGPQSGNGWPQIICLDPDYLTDYVLTVDPKLVELCGFALSERMMRAIDRRMPNAKDEFPMAREGKAGGAMPPADPGDMALGIIRDAFPGAEIKKENGTLIVEVKNDRKGL